MWLPDTSEVEPHCSDPDCVHKSYPATVNYISTLPYSVTQTHTTQLVYQFSQVHRVG